MTRERDQALQDLVNASGFVFQLGIEHQIRETADQHHWRVLSREHPWRSNEGSGFADLILGNGPIRLVLECKRPRDGVWIFLVPHSSARSTTRVRAQWASEEPGKDELLGWADFRVTPESDESEFCIVRGQGEGDRSMLERLAASLLQGLPSLAWEDLQGGKSSHGECNVVHIPIIVTTARLEVCFFSPADVDLTTGTLPTSQFFTVPYLRFRKNLALDLAAGAIVSDLRSAAQEKERTVLVVNSDHVPELLTKLNVTPTLTTHSWPWIAIREREARGFV